MDGGQFFSQGEILGRSGLYFIDIKTLQLSASSQNMKRKPDELRDIKIERNFPSAAEGSVLISAGNTIVICTASVNTDLPSWMRDQEEPKGWVTAEYNMMPGSTNPRKRRKSDGRSMEIQRLISRVLRAAVDLKKMPGVLITCDCDVLKADGGTRTASITGAYVALEDAVSIAMEKGLLKENPILGPVAAVSVGIIEQKVYLDLDYELDYAADVDMNVAMNHLDEFIEIQGTAENRTFSRKAQDEMLDMAGSGIRRLIEIQKAALES